MMGGEDIRWGAGGGIDSGSGSGSSKHTAAAANIRYRRQQTYDSAADIGLTMKEICNVHADLFKATYPIT